MGNPLSPFLADLYMSNIETRVTKSFPWIFKTWVRYVDDIFAIIPKKQLEDSQKLLNLQDPSIKFTCETEKNNCIPFLDLLVIKKDNKIEFGIHRKETHTDSYIKKNGFNPAQHKQAVFNSLTFRLTNIPLNKEEYRKEYKNIIHTAEKNGYSKDIIDKKIKKFKKQQSLKSVTTLKLNAEPKIYRKFTYHPKFHRKFQKIFNEINIAVIPINQFNIQNLLKTNMKDKIPQSKKSGIYRINCHNCKKVYIGKTKRNLETREKEHFRNIKYKQVDKSAVAAHQWSNGHSIKKEADLLKNIQRPTELTVWEKIYIYKHSNNLMNFDLPAEYDLIKKYLTPPPEQHQHGQQENESSVCYLADDASNGSRNMS